MPAGVLGRVGAVGAVGARVPEPFPLPRKPNTLKQRNGFPPNFIHSLDSSHMMLTALHCYRWALRRGRAPSIPLCSSSLACRPCSGFWGCRGVAQSSKGRLGGQGGGLQQVRTVVVVGAAAQKRTMRARAKALRQCGVCDGEAAGWAQEGRVVALRSACRPVQGSTGSVACWGGGLIG